MKARIYKITAFLLAPLMALAEPCRDICRPPEGVQAMNKGKIIAQLRYQIVFLALIVLIGV